MPKQTEKEANPRSQRLPRETGALIVPMGDGLTTLERAKGVLQGRLKETSMGFFLDGCPVSIDRVLEAAGVKPDKPSTW